MKLNIYNTPDEVLAALAQHFANLANSYIKSNGKFTVALSGGSSPKKLYELLTTNYKDQIDWDKIYFFFGDERNVPHSHPDSNFLMVQNALFAPLNIPFNHIFPIDTKLPPHEAAAKYEEEIVEFFDENELSFDLVLLGLGDNSHTASLFPHTPVLHDRIPGVKEVFLQDQQVFRITLNAPLINEASHIAFLVYGAGKAIAVHHILEDEEDIEEYPAQLIEPIVGEIEWFLDAPAAALVNK
jgi:6-phosphogluconolactonase